MAVRGGSYAQDAARDGLPSEDGVPGLCMFRGVPNRLLLFLPLAQVSQDLRHQVCAVVLFLRLDKGREVVHEDTDVSLEAHTSSTERRGEKPCGLFFRGELKARYLNALAIYLVWVDVCQT